MTDAKAKVVISVCAFCAFVFAIIAIIIAWNVGGQPLVLHVMQAEGTCLLFLFFVGLGYLFYKDVIE